MEITATIEQEEGEPKVRTKTVTLLGARKGDGKATFPNGDAYGGPYFGGLRHGSGGSYTYAAQPPALNLSMSPPLPHARSSTLWPRFK